MTDRQPYAPLETDPRTGAPLTDEARASLQESARTILGLIHNVEAYRRRLAHSMGVSVTELRALGRIGAGTAITPRSLADELGLTTGSVTPLLDRLEQASYIRRTPHPHDRRSIQLELTDTGSEAVAAAYRTFQSRLLAAVQAMPGDAVCTVNEFLRIAAGGYEPVEEPELEGAGSDAAPVPQETTAGGGEPRSTAP